MKRVQVVIKAQETLVTNVKKALNINGYISIGELTKQLWREWLEKHSWCVIDSRFHCPTPSYALKSCVIGGPRCSYLNARYENNTKIVRAKP